MDPAGPYRESGKVGREWRECRGHACPSPKVSETDISATSPEAWSSGRIGGPTCWIAAPEGLPATTPCSDRPPLVAIYKRWLMHEGARGRFRAVHPHFGVDTGRRIAPDRRSPVSSRGRARGKSGERQRARRHQRVNGPTVAVAVFEAGGQGLALSDRDVHSAIGGRVQRPTGGNRCPRTASPGVAQRRPKCSSTRLARVKRGFP